MKLSVLDHSGVSAGQTPDEAIRNSLALAALCDTLGYHRYWVSEHHNSASVAGTAPEVLIAAIAATTRTMRIGSGGVMLPHYSALKVAEQFRVLEAIAPGRIDLGIGRAPGTDGHTAQALNPHAFDGGEDRFPAQLRDLLGWVRGTGLPPSHPFARISAQPEGGTAPEAWMMGSSDYGAQLAGYFGLPYCFAHFFRPGPQGDTAAERALLLYRDTFRPSETLAAPRAGLCVGALAADTAEQAAYQAEPGLLMRLWRDRGLFAPMPSPETAAGYRPEAHEQAALGRARAASIHGTGAEVRTGLEALAARAGRPDELFVVSIAYDPLVRRRSFSLIAEAFGLGLTAGSSRAA